MRGTRERRHGLKGWMLLKLPVSQTVLLQMDLTETMKTTVPKAVVVAAARMNSNILIIIYQIFGMLAS